jgi:hypothetical protein
MTIDHIGAVLLPQYLILRVIGRVSFPIYCFLLVNGFLHTSSVKKYIIRLSIFAIISEIFFDKTFFGSFVYVNHQNVFFTLLIGMVMLAGIEWLRKKISCIADKSDGGIIIISYTLEGILVIIACATAYFFQTDYSFYGILMIYWFYALRFNKIIMGFFQAYTNLGMMGGIQGFACAALIPIYMYNGEKGNADYKWWFYIYYPLHLFVIGMIKGIINT